MAVSKRLRYEILRRDNHTCRYCGATAPDVPLVVDHVIPVALGGTDDTTNLVAACADCNSGKTSSNPDQPLVDDVAASAFRWAAAMKRAAEQQRQDHDAIDQFRRAIWRQWLIAFVGRLWIEEDPGWYRQSDPDRTYDWVVHSEKRQGVHLADSEEEAQRWIDEKVERESPPLPDDWDASLHAWLAAGIDDRDVAHAAQVTARADHIGWWQRYRYFCGVIWRTIDDRQKIARAILEQEGDA